ncbi:hypothetical protein [Streptomyces sp. G-G2]|uniref:hypothetical protein n=1 Tax=Streptomyces sp. G-G2 TaxID=3046201 RepID=UPI0024BB91BC|nr:hypothetical protein [Streptomyces sp. G-G2]MDJ0384778.1 hypothetical protein [Streptomyces sp. G-G2]
MDQRPERDERPERTAHTSSPLPAGGGAGAAPGMQLPVSPDSPGSLAAGDYWFDDTPAGGGGRPPGAATTLRC